MAKGRNIIEEIIGDLVDRLVDLKFDICRCDLCKSEIKRIIVERLPPCFVDSDSPEYVEIRRRIFHEISKDILYKLTPAFNQVSNNPPHKIDGNREQWFDELLERIYQDRGVNFSQYRRDLLKRRVALRMKATRSDSYPAYLKILVDNPDEYKKLFEVLTINVSEFFRDPGVWDALKKFFRKLVFDFSMQERKFKVWHAGCAHGEEPYSLAIMLREAGISDRFDLRASDVDSEAIRLAKEGRYHSNSLKNVPEDLRRRYFEQLDHSNYFLKDVVRSMVLFERQDLINDKYPQDIDIIFCRNVFIYFNKALKENVLSKFYNCLNPDGYFILGMAEIILAEAKVIF
ncbi:MAG: protein-glutamate O-methyltransferase CheR, partial [Candidatus Omnitrophota bacterium]